LHHSEGGHDDYCFIAGTKVLTGKGQVNIEELKVGDFVMTRKGLKPIIKIGNRMARVISRFGLTGTPEHPFITPNGIEKFINVSGLIYIWNEKQSSIMEKHIIDTQILKEDNYEYRMVTEIGENMIKESIKRVYNISVKDCNEYFANNILVHNCDGLVLACNGLRSNVNVDWFFTD
jgi:intein/homing endonuclease